jgi:hypothetical protein
VFRRGSPIPDPADHHDHDHRGDPDQRGDHHGLSHEFDRPGLEIVGETAGIGAFGEGIDGGRQLVAGEVDVLFDGLGIPIRPCVLQFLRAPGRCA